MASDVPSVAWTCQSCRAQNLAGDASCHHCGVRYSVSSSTVAATPNVAGDDATNAATKGKTNVFARLHAELEAQNGAQPRADAPAGAVETPAAAKTTPTKRKRGR